MLSYGGERLLENCRETGINGFIVVNLPPDEAITFREFFTSYG
jgi:tryptophan synthase